MTTSSNRRCRQSSKPHIRAKSATARYSSCRWKNAIAFAPAKKAASPSDPDVLKQSGRTRRLDPRIEAFCFYASPVNLHGSMRVRLSKTFHFEAAHDLPTFPDGHKCRRLHGHSFRFDVIVEGEVPPAKGYLIDYGDIKSAADPVVKQLDHYYLNKIEGLENPTSEMICHWLWKRLKPALPDLAAIIV